MPLHEKCFSPVFTRGSKWVGKGRRDEGAGRRGMPGGRWRRKIFVMYPPMLSFTMFGSEIWLMVDIYMVMLTSTGSPVKYIHN
jgi:hypothetical protein